MKAIIIAGGESKRLRPLTEHIPKTLLPLEEKMIIEHILESVVKNNIHEIVVLTGHGHEHVLSFVEKYRTEHPAVRIDTQYIQEYADFGNIIALRAAKQLLESDSIIINSDTVFHPDILAALLQNTDPYAMAIDDVKILGEEEMKVHIDDNNRIYKIHKSLDPKTAHGEYVGILKFEKGIHLPLSESTEKMIASDPSVYYEDAIQQMIDDHNVAITRVSTQGLPVIEIDTPEDLEAAKMIIEKIRS